MKRSISSHHINRIPQRTCLACRKTKDKRQLIRLVRTSDGKVEVDTTGKKSGRGAYLCSAKECWQDGLKSGRLEYSLRTKLTQGDLEQLSRFGDEFFEGVR